MCRADILDDVVKAKRMMTFSISSLTIYHYLQTFLKQNLELV